MTPFEEFCAHLADNGAGRYTQREIGLMTLAWRAGSTHLGSLVYTACEGPKSVPLSGIKWEWGKATEPFYEAPRDLLRGPGQVDWWGWD